MRSILGLLIGLYLTCALVVLGGGVYGFLTHKNTPHAGCADAALPGQGGAGSTNWIPFTLMRAAIWPKAYYDDMKRTSDVIDWLVVKYDPFPSGCS